MTNVDWGSVGGEVTELLQDLLRVDTTNPPGNETACATHIAGVLGAEGIESDLLEKEPGRGNLIARLRGTGELPPLLLMAHMDVVILTYTMHPEVIGRGHRMLMLERLIDGLSELGARFVRIDSAMETGRAWLAQR